MITKEELLKLLEIAQENTEEEHRRVRFEEHPDPELIDIYTEELRFIGEIKQRIEPDLTTEQIARAKADETSKDQITIFEQLEEG